LFFPKIGCIFSIVEDGSGWNWPKIMSWQALVLVVGFSLFSLRYYLQVGCVGVFPPSSGYSCCTRMALTDILCVQYS